jgi:hypothetical protein
LIDILAPVGVFAFGMFVGYLLGLETGLETQANIAETPDSDPRDENPMGGYVMAPTRNNPDRGK